MPVLFLMILLSYPLQIQKIISPIAPTLILTPARTLNRIQIPTLTPTPIRIPIPAQIQIPTTWIQNLNRSNRDKNRGWDRSKSKSRSKPRGRNKNNKNAKKISNIFWPAITNSAMLCKKKLSLFKSSTRRKEYTGRMNRTSMRKLSDSLKIKLMRKIGKFRKCWKK